MAPDRNLAVPVVTLGPRTAGLLVFLTSGAVLVLEIVSLRLIAPYVGLTLEMSTAVIGVALAAIAFGAWSGGLAADALPPARLLGPLLLGGGALVLAVHPLVRWVGEAVRGGDISAVLAITGLGVFVPAALLSAVFPVVVKLRLASLTTTGTVVGRLSGIGTAGALVATFVTGFVLVAMVPTRIILVGLGAVLIAVGGWLTMRFRGTRLAGRAVAGPLALAAVALAITPFAPQPCQVETAYHCARVTADPARPTGRLLELDTLRHSYVDLADPTHLEFVYTRAIASAIDTHRPAGVPMRALHLGAGGLTLPRYLAATRPGSESSVLEIDRGVVAIGVEELGTRRIPGVTTRVRDARVGVATEPSGSRDLVIGDAFGGVAVPWHLATREFVADIRRVLTGEGLYALNVIDYPPLAFLRAEIATVAAVFPHVAVVAPAESLAGRQGGNFVVLASAAPLPMEALRDRSGVLSVLSGEQAVDAFVGDARVLTDDFAPVDQLLTPYPRAAVSD